jgi:F0F1-type ATP synthase assembly protein I
MFPGSGDQRELGRYLAIGQVGMEMVAPAVLGVVLDSYFGISPWGVGAGAAIGLVGGLFHLVRMTKPPDRNEPASPGQEPPGRDTAQGSQT